MITATPRPNTAARARELLVLASLMAAVLWGIALVDATSGSNRGRLSGLPVGTDFINFYTLAHVGYESRYGVLASLDTFHAEQVRVLPGSDAVLYPPVYPPQVALLLSPLARLTYWQAYFTWIVVSLGLYGLVVWRFARATPALSAWPWQVAAVAAANPALWFVALHGQVSVLALAAFGMAWAALRHNRPWLAGVALGALAFKPSLFVPAFALVIVAGECGRGMAGVAVGALAGTLLLLAATVPWVGTESVRQYVVYTLGVLAAPDQVATNPPLMHSLRTFWSGLLPSPVSTFAYGLTALAVIAYGASAWRRAPTALARVGLLSAVVVLASPHLFAYDLVILTPLVMASAERLMTRRASGRLLPLTYLGFVAPIWGVPAVLLGVQASTLAVVTWLARPNSTRSTRRPRRGPASGARGELIADGVAGHDCRVRRLRYGAGKQPNTCAGGRAIVGRSARTARNESLVSMSTR